MQRKLDRGTHEELDKMIDHKVTLPSDITEPKIFIFANLHQQKNKSLAKR